MTKSRGKPQRGQGEAPSSLTILHKENDHDRNCTYDSESPQADSPQHHLACFARCAGKNGIIRITIGKQSDDYIIDRLESDFGTAYSLERWDASDVKKEPRYFVCLNGSESRCECTGFSYTGGCKHIDGLVALYQASKL